MDMCGGEYWKIVNLLTHDEAEQERESGPEKVSIIQVLFG